MLRILLIDDDPFSYETVKGQLFQDGYELIFRDNGLDAVRQVSRVAPDVILLDLIMPGISGLEVCRLLKKTPQLEHIPIILCAPLDGAENITAALAAGADDFLTKPMRRTELRTRLHAMVRMKQQYDTFQATLRRRELFASVLLHDMRNPLSGISLYAQLLQKRGELNHVQQQYLRLIREESQRLRLLFEQMQLLNKLQQGQQKIRRQLIDIRLLLLDVAAQYATTADTVAVELAVAIPQTPLPRLSIDRSLLQHMIEQLISHALRFAPNRSTVKVEIATTLEADAYPVLQIAVTDQGPPLATTALDDIYEQVEQWDLTTPERPGSGVTMALCKMIVEAHEGRLFIQNQTTGEISFVTELPIPETEWRPSSHFVSNVVSRQ
jgi:two-component system, sensor histidine kinase and response regulator